MKTQRKTSAAQQTKQDSDAGSASPKEAAAPGAGELVARRSGTADGGGAYMLIGSVTPATGEVSFNLDGQYLTGSLLPDLEAVSRLPKATSAALRGVIEDLKAQVTSLPEGKQRAAVLGELASVGRAAR